jgi:hypothetical protein
VTSRNENAFAFLNQIDSIKSTGASRTNWLAMLSRRSSRAQRILSGAIVERFVRGPEGELEPMTDGSTRPVAETRTHAGIVRVRHYTFEMP